MFKSKLVRLMLLTLVLSLLMFLILTGCGKKAEEAEPDANKPSIDYPLKPIQFVIPFGAGGDVDLVARTLANDMSKILGQTVVPVNKAGAGGSLGYNETRLAANDGYTLVWVTTSLLSSSNMGNLDYDYTAFEPVSLVELVPMPLAVRGDSPYKSYQDFVNEAKKNPGTLKVGNAGAGSDAHLQAVQMARLAGIEVIHVPLGIERRTSSILSGEVDAIVSPLPEIRELTEAGELSLLAMPTTERVAGFEEVPTLMELGYDFTHYLFRGVMAPKGTPAEIIEILDAAVEEVVQSQSFKDYAERRGFNPAFLGSKDFAAWLAEENQFIANWLQEAEL